ncbi:hypothetical protein DPMN_048046 [Dreissena polymorpha]|uniref:Uncharacterized protein n=1 Tax=Dreissena polymorpha TaxID=45954 RepID=A0A9D4I218_DREPO|nr:hypothetical protein DPMN_048046 [Dreissena polymorpha]
MLKLAQTNQPTNQPTNQQTNQQTGQKQYGVGDGLGGFHDDWAKNVISRVHVIQLTGTIFKLNYHFKETNVLTKFHEHWAKNKNTPPTGGHVFSPILTIFELVRDINKTNVLTNFHDWTKIVTSRVLTRKTAPPPGSLVIQLTRTIFELNSHIKETNVLTKFHENWAKNVTSRRKMPRPLAAMFFHRSGLVRDINKTNVLTNFHDDWAKIVTSRVFTSHVIQLTGTIFKLNSHIKETNVLNKFHENYAKNVISRVEKCPAHWLKYINKTNVFTNFHDDWAKIVTSRVFTRKTAPPTGDHVFQRTGNTFELNQHIIKTNILTNIKLDRDFIGTKLLTKFHEDRTINVASRVFTNQMWTTDGRTATDKDRS